MNVEWIRRYCRSLPHTTETVQWGYDLVFKIVGEMYAVAPLESAPVVPSFKCSPDDFAELTKRPGKRQAYVLILAKLPKKAQTSLK